MNFPGKYTASARKYSTVKGSITESQSWPPLDLWDLTERQPPVWVNNGVKVKQGDF